MKGEGDEAASYATKPDNKNYLYIIAKIFKKSLHLLATIKLYIYLPLHSTRKEQMVLLSEMPIYKDNKVAKLSLLSIKIVYKIDNLPMKMIGTTYKKQEYGYNKTGGG